MAILAHSALRHHWYQGQVSGGAYERSMSEWLSPFDTLRQKDSVVTTKGKNVVRNAKTRLITNAGKWASGGGMLKPS
ncbi:hypothetical protein OCU04_005229 [Sclerotinia nivalis]|uniref:Uncharacterized protein n=1 Tax=Sclerotinia nivalis TaxID=352851 RepID=A0A9X0DML4_9HELO|nr:hypothetical protein OCU04_005229 [Sclerotinia nivalis]